MNFNYLENLNPTFEILALIYGSKNYDKLLKRSINLLNESGVNGELFVKKHLKLLDKYIREFEKKANFEGVNELFEYDSDEEDVLLFMTFFSTIISNMEELKSINNLSKDTLKNFILNAYFDTFNKSKIDRNLTSTDEILSFLEKEHLSNKNKWLLLKFLSNPQIEIENLLKIIDNNQEAYVNAYNSIEGKIAKFISKTEKYILSGDLDLLNNLCKGKSSLTIVPTLAFGISVLDFNGTIYLSVLAETALNERSKSIGTKGNLVLKLKAISDNSKLETLSLLKSNPRYSLEIAEALKLTPATVSYHMSTLLDIGFVSVEKHSGKVYYNLNKELIEKFINELKETLL